MNDRTEELARRVRNALGEFDDPNMPVVELVRDMAACLRKYDTVPKPEAQAAAVYYSGSPASLEAAARVLLAAGWRLEANGWQQSVGTSDQGRFNTWAKSAGLITESSGLVFVNSHCDTAWLAWQAALSTPASHDAQQPAREEMSPDFTDSARAAIAWVLYHHQGGSSPVGQPLRFALGMGAHEPLPDWRIAEAKAWAEWASATTADFHAQQPAVVGDGPIDANDSADYIEHCAASLESFGLRVTAGALRVIAAEHRDLAALTPAATPGAAMPKEREVARLGDMSTTDALRVGFDADRDVYLSTVGDSVEFCTCGIGGGKSPRTRDALVALMVAMEADNAEDPRRDWWALRNSAQKESNGNG